MQEFLNQPETSKLGYVVILTTWLAGVWSWITEHGNQTVVTVTGLGGLILLYFAIRAKKKENTLKDLEIKIKQKELENLDNE